MILNHFKSRKGEETRDMFNNIAGSYDFLNHLLSAGIDISWRKKAVKLLSPLKPQFILDIATGTADVAIELLTLNPQKVVGVDIAEKMLETGRKKIKHKNLDAKIELQIADAANLPFKNDCFDAVTVAFGVRNFSDLELGLKEMLRVLKPGGKVVILEFSRPKKFPVKQIYNFYFHGLLPAIGKLISNHNSAYSYLPDSVKSFPDGETFINILKKTGYKSPDFILLNLGIASIYTGEK